MRFFKPPAYIRVLHASPDAPAVDVYLNNKKVVSNLPFKNITDYLKVKPGKYMLEIYPSAVPILRPVFRKQVVLPAGSIYTVAAINKLDNLNIYIINDPQTQPDNDISYLRAVHLSTDAPAVNVKVDSRTICRNLKYKDVSRYANLDPETYDISIFTTAGGDKVLTKPNQVLQPGFYQTIYIIGLVEGITPIQTIIPLDGMYKFLKPN